MIDDPQAWLKGTQVTMRMFADATWVSVVDTNNNRVLMPPQ